VERFFEGTAGGLAPEPVGAAAGEAYPFHRLTRSWPGHRWWKPLLTGVLGVSFYLVFIIVVLIIGGISVFLDPAQATSYLERLQSLDLTDPLVFGFTMVTLILMIPALALAALITGPRPVGLLSSVRGRIRWGWLGRCVAAAVGIYSLSLALSFVIEPLFPGYAPPALDLAGPQVGVMIAMTLLLVPFQAAAEEYVFRGYLMQTVGSWLRHPAFAILLPVPLFVLGHGYDPLGQTDVALFAIFAGWLTWRTGGLEAAIAAHAVNNATIFLLGAVGLIDANSKEGSPIGLAVSVLTMAAFAAVVLRMFNRSEDLERTRLAAPAPAPYGFMPPYGHHQYGQYPSGQNQQYGQNQYAQNPPPQGPYGQHQYGQNQYGQNPPDQYAAPQYPSAQYPSAQYPSAQYPSAQNPSAQDPYGQKPPAQYPPAKQASGPVDGPQNEARRD
jgi:membrane protease YdiL (CAAX protease family)